MVYPQKEQRRLTVDDQHKTHKLKVGIGVVLVLDVTKGFNSPDTTQERYKNCF